MPDVNPTNPQPEPQPAPEPQPQPSPETTPAPEPAPVAPAVSPEVETLKAEVTGLKTQVEGSLQMNKALLDSLKDLSGKVAPKTAEEDTFAKDLYEANKAPDAIVKKINEVVEARTRPLVEENTRLRQQNATLARDAVASKMEFYNDVKDELELALAGHPDPSNPKVVEAAYNYALGKKISEGKIKPADMVARRSTVSGATPPTPSRGGNTKPKAEPLSEEEDFVRQKFGRTVEEWNEAKGAMRTDYIKQSNKRGIRGGRTLRAK